MNTINTINTTMVMFDKSKLTKIEMAAVRKPLEGITLQENDTHIMVYDLEYKQQKYMSRMIDILYKTIRR